MNPRQPTFTVLVTAITVAPPDRLIKLSGRRKENMKECLEYQRPGVCCLGTFIP